MECQRRAKSLVVLTLLQLCRAEIKDAQPQWYSANIINDGFQPKSISELFSSEAPFSTANPIIVSPKSNNDDIIMLSTMTPPTSLSSTSASGFGKTSTSTFPSTTQSSLSSYSPSQSSFSKYATSQTPQYQQYMPRMNQNQQSYQQINQPSVEFRQQTSPADFEPMKPMQPLLKLVSELQSQPQRNVQIQQEPSTSTLFTPPSAPMIKLTTFYQPPVTETTQLRDLRYEFPQDTQTSLGPESSTARPPQTIPPQSNYFLIYQQAPQSIQSYPNPSSSAPTTLGEESFSTTDAPPITSTFPSTFTSPSSTFSTIGNLPLGTSPLFYSTTRAPITQHLPSSTSPRVTVTSLSTIGSSSSMGSSSSGTRVINCMLPKSTTPLPRLTLPNSKLVPIDALFPLKIRVLAPSGSITNVNFNPATKSPISQQKYVAYTTRKPSSRRTPKPRKNTYDRCLQGCRKNGQTLCAAPLSQFPIDPKTLRGFPSVCHMACHNSYRKDPYEKIIDGSCGKLRTRIRPIDSDSKLKRDELQKVQYFLDNSGQHAVVEFTGAYV